MARRKKRTCKYDIIGDSFIITTSKGDKIICDATDYEELCKYSWCISGTGYPVANVNNKVTKMSRHLFGDDCNGLIVDHINHNLLDNRRRNLRLTDATGNARNCSKSKNGKNPYIGVRLTPSGKYNVRITFNRKEIHVGNYGTLGEAIAERCKAEDKYFGEFAPHKSLDVSIWEAE